MSESEEAGGPDGRRRLAAIVFTDVVGFSARVQEDEDRTLKLVHRDFAFMKKVCARTGGQVLKSTGDGLLLFFNSAVEAVQCALEIQRAFSRAAQKLPPSQLLQHRVGIHLGDVFVEGSDVMGDGVNIAARIQAEAEPGGICISQTVYDVVKNRVGIQTTYLGPRDLKNIREAVPVYSILLAAQGKVAGGKEPAGAGRRKVRRLIWAIAAATVLIAAGVGVWLAVRPGGEGGPQGEGGGARAGSGGEAGKKGGSATSAPGAEEANRRRLALLRVYDFKGLAAWARHHPDLARSADGRPLEPMYDQIAFLLDWFGKDISRRREANALIVHLPNRSGGGESEKMLVWGAGEGRIALQRGSGVRQSKLADLRPGMLAIILMDAIAAAPPRADAPKRQLRKAIAMFLRQYRIVDLAKERMREVLDPRGSGERPRRGPGRRLRPPSRRERLRSGT